MVGDPVDLLVGVPPRVLDVEVFGARAELEAVGVAQSVREDPRRRDVAAGRRVVGERRAGVRIDAEDRAVVVGRVSRPVRGAQVGLRRAPPSLGGSPQGLGGDPSWPYRRPRSWPRRRRSCRARGPGPNSRSPTEWLRNCWHQSSVSYQLGGGAPRAGHGPPVTGSRWRRESRPLATQVVSVSRAGVVGASRRRGAGLTRRSARRGCRRRRRRAPADSRGPARARGSRGRVVVNPVADVGENRRLLVVDPVQDHDPPGSLGDEHLAVGRELERRRLPQVGNRGVDREPRWHRDRGVRERRDEQACEYREAGEAGYAARRRAWSGLGHAWAAIIPARCLPCSVAVPGRPLRRRRCPARARRLWGRGPGRRGRGWRGCLRRGPRLRRPRAQVRIGPRPSGSRRLAARGGADRRAAAARRGSGDPRPASAPKRRRHDSRASVPATVLLGAHHDTMDGIPGFVGANDGASGVAVLLEIARVPAAALSAALTVTLLLRRRGGAAGAPFAVGRRSAAAASSSRSRRRAAAGVAAACGRSGRCTCSTWSATATSRSRARRTPTPSSTSRLAGPPFGGETSPITDDHVPFLEAGVPAVDVIDFGYGPGGPPGAWWHTPRTRSTRSAARACGQVGAGGASGPSVPF